MRRPLSVRGRTTAVAAIVVGAALVVGAVGLAVLLRVRLIDAQRTAAELRARDVATLAQHGDLPVSLSFPGDDEGLTQVIDADGNVVTSTANLRGEPAISQLAPGVGQTRSEIVDTVPIGEGDRFILVATTVDTSSGPLTVISSASLEEADETFRTITRALLLGIPVLVGMVALVTRALVGRALRPVEQMRREVSTITESDLHRRLEEPETGDEIALLAGTLNAMLGRLDEASERQRRFVADASHELRSPLASARAALEVAVAHPDRIDAGEAMASALADQDRLEQLVDDLLVLARASDRSATAQGPVDLRHVAEEEVRAADDERLQLELGPRPCVVTADRRLLARIVRNLLDNARRHARSQVRVTLEAGTDWLELRVDDDGPGIPEGDRQRIFDRFTRLDEARTQASGGNGLGLSIVRAAVTDLGGEVTASASDLGGARFTVRLPAVSSDLEREPAGA